MDSVFDQLFATLHALGIASGDVIVVEAPGTNLAAGPEGFQRLAAVLRRVVGPEGTVVIPTCTHHEGLPKPAFDPLLTPSEMGPFSEFFRQQRGVLRSHSPTHSVAACGPLASEIVAGHRSAAGRPSPWGEGAFGRGSPWDILAAHGAQWVMLGAGWQDSAFTAYVQALYAEQHSGITRETPFPRFKAEALG